MASVSLQFLSVATLILAGTLCAEGKVLFSSLEDTLLVNATIQGKNNTFRGIRRAKVGEDRLMVSWVLNGTLTGLGVDKVYYDVKIRLCFAPISQVERGWRKTNDDLHKDKTCSIRVATQKYTTDGNSTVWEIPRNVPGATYFIRVYATNADGVQLAYGQTTDDLKTSNLIAIEPITGRHVSINIASAVCSVTSIAALAGFLLSELRRMKK